MLTYFVVQSFERGKNGAVIANTPVQVVSAEHAERLAARLSEKKAGVVAFSRTGDPSTGDYEDAVVIALHGSVSMLEDDRAIAC